LFQKYSLLLKNIVWRSLQIAARNGFSYAIFYLASILLYKEDFGYYNYILKIAFFITLFVDFGISMAVSKYTAEFSNGKNEKIKPLVANGIIIILILAALMAAITPLLNSFVFDEAYNKLLYLLPLFVLVPLTSLFDAAFRGLKRFRELSLLTLITGLISLPAFYFLIRHFGVTGAFLSQNLFYLLMLAGFWSRFKVVPRAIDREVFGEASKYAAVIGVTGVFMFLSTQVDVLFLGYFGYFTEVGYYEIIFKFLALLMMPYAIIGHVISPDFTRHYANKNFGWIKQNLKRSIALSFVLSSLVCVALYFGLPYVFEHFFTKYNTLELNKMSQIVMVLFFTNMFNGFIPLLAIATGHARWGMYFIVVVGGLNVLFDYISIIQWGVWGLIYATVILKSTANILFIGYYYLKLPKA